MVAVAVAVVVAVVVACAGVAVVGCSATHMRMMSVLTPRTLLQEPTIAEIRAVAEIKPEESAFCKHR